MFTFTGNHATKLKRRNRERTSVNTDIRSRTLADIFVREERRFYRPIKFLSDLTVGPTYFAKYVYAAASFAAIVESRYLCNDMQNVFLFFLYEDIICNRQILFSANVDILHCSDAFTERKGRDLTQPYDRSPYTDRKIQKATWQHKERHQKLRLHNDCGPT